MDVLQKDSKKQINKLVISMVAGNLGSGILTFAIGLLILQETNSAVNFGFSQLIGPLISFFLLPIKGSIVDKFQKKNVLFFSQVFSLVGLFMYAVTVSFHGIDNLVYTYLLLIVLEISDQFLSVTFTASISTIVIKDHIQKVQSIKQVFSSLTMIIIPVTAVFLVSQVSLLTLVLIEMLLEIIAIIAISMINFTLTNNIYLSEEKKSTSMISLFKEGLIFVIQYKKLVFALFFAMLVNFIFGAVNIGLPFLQVSVLNFSNLVYGLSEAIFAIGMIFTGIYLSLKDNIKFPLFTAIKMIGAIGVIFLLFGFSLIIGLSNHYLIVSVFLFNFIMGILVTRTNIPVTTWFIKEIPESYHGRVFNLLNAGGELLTPMGIFLFSFLFDHYSGYLIFIVSGILILLTVILYPLSVKINLKNNSLE